ncbi:FG-GAP-like repeat-containing protein [Streptomyces sp. NPDC004111]|uniref:FG-GAP-like repeat-containing protein n=1 Tax=Streptomyces sp. NPDC004111 TaxID=3364690 RepID=UPI0036B9D790
MNRRNRLRSAAAVAAVLGTAAGLVPVLGGAAVAAQEPVGEVVVPSIDRKEPRNVFLGNAGATGYVHSQEGGDRTEWVDFATGAAHDAYPPHLTTNYGGTAAALLRSPTGGDDQVQLRDLPTGRTSTLPIPAGTRWTQGYTADTILVGGYDETARTYTALRQVRADGSVVREFGGLPENTTAVTLVRQDGRGGLFQVRNQGNSAARFFLLDYSSGTFRPLHDSSAGTSPQLNDDRIAWIPATGGTLRTLSRAEPAEPPRDLALPVGRVAAYAVGKDWLFFRLAAAPDTTPHPAGQPLRAVPLNGGAVRELLPRSTGGLRALPDGGAVAMGGTDAQHWAVHRIGVDADGTPRATAVRAVPAVAATRQLLAIGGNRINYLLPSGTGFTGVYELDAPGDGAPKVRAWEINAPHYAPVPLGDGQSAYLSDGRVKTPRELNTHRPLDLPGYTEAVELVAASGRYAVVNAADGKQYVGDFEIFNGTSEVLTRPAPSAAALWGSTLWKPAATAGSIDSYDVKTKRTTPAVNTGSGCVPTSLQAVGRWVYWQCTTAKAGVLDATTGKNITAPVGGKLGDGFVVTKTADDRLRLTDLLKAGATADFSAPGVTVGDWAVDAYGGPVAYTDAEQRIRLKPSGVARQAVSVIEQQVDGTAVARQAADPWNARFLLSRPVARWTVTFTDHRGRTLATRTGTARTGAQIAPEWDGKDDKGNVVVGGRHTWTLTTDAGDGTGPQRTATGALYLSGAKDTPRDYDGDGYGDVMTFTTGGTLHTHQLGTNGTDRLTQSGGWPKDSTFVPYGDLTGDGCNDVLVRDASGALDRFDGTCTGAVKPTGPRTRIGTGYQQYDVLTSPGDLTGDGRPDLVARHRTTYDVYLLAAKPDGKLAYPVKIRPNWKAYSHVVGAGDLNGDGHGDLLARASNGDLWRYDGTPNGQFKERVLVFTGWGIGYKEIVGVGDVSGDGRADLMVRDTAGGIFRNEGDGKGGFGARRALTTGWQGYKSLF